MKKHYVVFFSPGTIFSETDTKEIDSWNVPKAKKMADNIHQRYGATPYGFQFITRERKSNDFDSKETKRSGTYFLGGKIMTLDQIVSRNDPSDKILISNMRINKIERVIENTNSYKSVLPFNKNDKLLKYSVPNRRGS